MRDLELMEERSNTRYNQRSVQRVNVPTAIFASVRVKGDVRLTEEFAKLCCYKSVTQQLSSLAQVQPIVVRDEPAAATSG